MIFSCSCHSKRFCPPNRLLPVPLVLLCRFAGLRHASDLIGRDASGGVSGGLAHEIATRVHKLSEPIPSLPALRWSSFVDRLVDMEPRWKLWGDADSWLKEARGVTAVLAARATVPGHPHGLARQPPTAIAPAVMSALERCSHEVARALAHARAQMPGPAEALRRAARASHEGLLARCLPAKELRRSGVALAWAATRGHTGVSAINERSQVHFTERSIFVDVSTGSAVCRCSPLTEP